MSDTARAIDPTLFDSSVTPAQDFFRHVNGGWLDANPVPPEYGSWGAFNEVNERNQLILHDILEQAAKDPGDPGSPSQMVGDYFAAAMDEGAIAAAGVSALQPLLDRIAAASSVADVRAVTVELQKAGVSALHSAGVSSDFENADAYLVYLGQGGMGLPERDYYFNESEQSVALRTAYQAHVANQLANLGYSADEAAGAAERIVAFETGLAQDSYPAEKLRDVRVTMNRYSVKSLDELMPAFGMSGYVTELGTTTASVCVDNPGFFTALETALSATPIETLKDYLRWQLVRSYASALTPAFENESFEFYGKLLSGQQQMKARWKRIIDAIGADIGEQLSQLYVAKAFSEDAKLRLEEMVNHLLSAMGRSIRDADWMTQATREAALEKLAGFGYKIGYPDTWRDYSGLVITRDSHAGNRLAAARFEHEREMGRLGQPVDRTEWGMPAHVINAYYHPLLNEIVFPAAILQPPFFYPQADDAVNYGAIGAVIGHEITHGFDDNGSRFDAKGSLRDWWTESDRAEFDRRAQLIVAQFDEIMVADDLHVNGRLTLGENIADLGGLSLALSALHEAHADSGEPIDGYSPTQRFFLSWATVWRTNYTPEYARLLVNVDPHSPARARVNAPLANTPAFAQAFEVPEGSPMRRAEELRAHIW